MAQPAGFGAVFEIADAFRADPSFTSRHATEFTSVDAEFSWIESHEDVMAMHEEVLVAGITAVKEKYGKDIEEVFGFELQIPTTPFPRVTLADARKIVADSGYEVVRADGDLDPEGERRVSAWAKEHHGSEFVFVTDYDASIRPYYHMRHADDPTLTNSYDLLFNGAEISTGAQREHRVDVLTAQAEEKGLDAAEPRLVPRLLPLRGPAARWVRDGPGARADAHARRAVDPRGHVPLPRADAPHPVVAGRQREHEDRLHHGHPWWSRSSSYRALAAVSPASRWPRGR